MRRELRFLASPMAFVLSTTNSGQFLVNASGTTPSVPLGISVNWECPNLLSLPSDTQATAATHFVSVGTQPQTNYRNRSSQYFAGTLNSKGKLEVASDSPTGFVDYGNLYAITAFK